MTEKRFQYIRGVYKHGIHDVQKDGKYRKGYRPTYDSFDLDKIVDELNVRENKIKQLENENEQLKQQLDNNLQFLIRASERLGFESLDHLLYTLDKGEITGYSTANWEKR